MLSLHLKEQNRINGRKQMRDTHVRHAKPTKDCMPYEEDDTCHMKRRIHAMRRRLHACTTCDIRHMSHPPNHAPPKTHTHTQPSLASHYTHAPTHPRTHHTPTTQVRTHAHTHITCVCVCACVPPRGVRLTEHCPFQKTEPRPGQRFGADRCQAIPARGMRVYTRVGR